MTSIADTERAALCDLLDEIGPDAPTLCVGWTTRDLATHLYVRDRDPKAWAGISLSRLQPLAEKAMAQQADRPYEQIVAAVRSGAPKWSPMGVPGAKDLVNMLEFVIHHEDVRRAQQGWGPRAVPATLSDSVWRAIKLGSRATLRRAPDGVVLRRAGTDASVVAKKGELTVTVVGDPVELALFTSGRQRAARVDLSGDDAAVSRLVAAPLGF